MNETLSLIGALTVGLLGGVHCVGMCGGIVGALTVAMPGDTLARRLPLLFGYNAGRLFSYTLAGALFGGLGQLSSPLLPVQWMQSGLAYIAAAVLVLMGLYLGGWSNLLRYVERGGALFWRRIEPLGRRLLPVRRASHAVLVGMLWGWLPCGLVYSMLIWALGTGSAIDGALLLFVFGLGTMPNLLATGMLAHQFTTMARQPWLRRIAGIGLIGFGVYTLLRTL